MKTLSITYAKNHFCAVIKEVQHGTSILVSDYGKPVVRLESVDAGDQGVGESTLAGLEKKCLIRRACRRLPESFWEAAPVRTSDRSSVMEALLRERESGR